MGKSRDLDIHSTAERHIIDFRPWGWRDITVLGKYHYKQTRAALDTHAHRDMLELCFCSKGEQVYKVDGHLYRVKGGDLFVTYPGELHGTGEFPEEKGEMYWIIINMAAMGKAKRFLQFDGQLATEWKRQLLQLPRHFKGNTRLKHILDQVFHHHAQNTGLLDHIRVQHLLADFLLAVISCSQAAGVRKVEARMEKIDAYLSTHLDEPVMLPVLAMQAGLSLSRFKNWFKETTGTTPLDYVLKRRIQHAQEALQQGKLSITAIAYETGFQNAQYFSTVFKKFTGCTPGEYRERAGY
ncbi:AraC family transcriptional regulator [Chitinophaga agrisoli]|uniref:AraC family transcriptional regulator n=1 Tax=Chitinophaga agrisoli TaxID=2607653 RepID=A0A5B2VJW6_9BACT|nr:AraC family transcriptional regulator [Chitinophaga agrisoli]KAA2239245.1 AraC family transcriptional regulator [Chitinophaga agrisoli]